MLTLDLKSRFRNKTFLVSLVSALVLVAQQFGLSKYIPTNYVDIVNSVLAVLTMLGIIIDPTTTGLSDSVSASTQSTVISTTESVQATTEDVKTTTNDSNTTATISSAKVTVDNPDNTVSIGATVNSTSATTPQ